MRLRVKTTGGLSAAVMLYSSLAALAAPQAQAQAQATTMGPTSPRSIDDPRDIAAFEAGLRKIRDGFAAQSKRDTAAIANLNMGNALLPENLTTAAGIAKSRARLNAWQHLVEKRDRHLNKYIADVETYVLGSIAKYSFAVSADGVERYKQMSEKKRAQIKLYSAAQRDTAQVIVDILALAQKNIGQVEVSNGGLVFAAQDELDRFDVLLQELQFAGTREQAVQDAFKDFNDWRIL